jgi:hypothetical protein
MNEPSLALENILKQADQSPFLVEQLAIDLTNGLRSAEIGLRGFRSRPLLRRIWESATTQGQDRVAAIGSDIVAVQQATITLVKEIMSNEERTLTCLDQVVDNLQAVNCDLDLQMLKTSQFQHNLELQIAELRDELAQVELHLEEKMKYLIGREAAMNRLQRMFTTGMLYPGTGVLLSSALYLAQIARIFEGETETFIQKEWNLAKKEIAARAGNEVQFVPQLFWGAVEQVEPDLLEAVSYVTYESREPYLRVINALLERKEVRKQALKVQFDLKTAEEIVEITRYLHDPDDKLVRFQRPPEFAECLARELLHAQQGGTL